MKLEEYFRDIAILLDESMAIIEKTIRESKGERKELYLDYRKSIREMGGLLYQLIGKMRMDKVFDPETAEALITVIPEQIREESEMI